MTGKVLVDIAGLALIALVAWYFWFSSKKGERASASGAAQEALVTVKGGYDPDVIVVHAGKPVRLTFLRQESASCSERVIFPDFDVSKLLPQGERVVVEFTPKGPGEYAFSCQMGMYRGRVVAE